MIFSSVRRLLGRVAVKQTATEILVSGVPADVMQRDIARIWKTSRIGEHMFTKVGKNDFSFNLFFAPDIVYMLDVMSTHRSRFTSVKVIAQIRDELIRNTWLSRTLPLAPGVTPPQGRLDMSQLAKFHYKPLDYQQRYFDTYNRMPDQYNLNGYLLAAAPGSGKTFCGLVIGECLHADRIFVICPKNAVDRVWEKSLNELYKAEPPTYWIAANGRPYNGERVLIVHYEALQSLLQMLDQVDTSGTVQVILDESHNMNEITAQRTNYFLDLCVRTGSRNIIWASGTPVKALGAEIIPMLRSLDPYFTADTEARFKKIFGKDGSKGLDILRHRMGLISYKVEKKQLKLDEPIMKSLPVKVPTGHLYTLDAIRKVMETFINERVKYYQSRKPQDQKFFDRCVDHHKATLKSRGDWAEWEEYWRTLQIVIKTPDPRYIGEEIKLCNSYEKRKFQPSLPQEWHKDFKDVKSIIKYVNLKIQGECLGRVLGRMRIECHVAMVPYVDFTGVCESTQKKTLIFTSFVEALEAMDKQCKFLGLNPLVVYGKTNNELANTVKRFDKDPDINPLIATYNSLSTAVPLTMADTMIMLNSPFRAYIFDQAISRIHRIGADTQVVVYQAYLDTGELPNISTRSADILRWSQDMVEQITGVKSPFEVTDSVEAITLANAILDDHQLMYGVLSHAFERFDIAIDHGDFNPVQVLQAVRPSFMSW